ncbi:MAG TPA: hypothetical protein VL443_17960 [Cyclobacteriaceae bacterium]|nr:hypothetical protein [Cyclobacteriaceae bacterium]
MKNWIILFFYLIAIGVIAQPAVEAVKAKDLTLKDRYVLMKTKSQTYQDYKVIKETVLDGVWKITIDSLHEKNNALADTKKNVLKLKNQVIAAKNETVKTKESVAEILFDSTHINVLGINFNKKVFISTVGIIIAGLIVLLSMLFGRLRWMQSSSKEKVESLDRLTKEFDDFKHKALDKQMKLSRELQNERNKLQDMRPH